METQQYCNGLLLVPKTMSLHRNYLLSSVVTDIQDGNGLKHEKISQIAKHWCSLTRDFKYIV